MSDLGVTPLSPPQNFGVSLFERLARLGMPTVQLHTQRRMRPDIALYTKPLYAELIRDHACTRAYPPVRGVPAPVHFLSHSWPESAQGDSASKVRIG
jgi:hypothetical protein